MAKVQLAAEVYAEKHGTEKPDIAEIMQLFGNPEKGIQQEDLPERHWQRKISR